MMTMIRKGKRLASFERQFLRDSRLPYSKALAIFTALWQEAVDLGKLPPPDPMEGIEVDLRIARILNSCLKSSLQD